MPSKKRTIRAKRLSPATAAPVRQPRRDVPAHDSGRKRDVAAGGFTDLFEVVDKKWEIFRLKATALADDRGQPDSICLLAKTPAS